MGCKVNVFLGLVLVMIVITSLTVTAKEVEENPAANKEDGVEVDQFGGYPGGGGGGYPRWGGGGYPRWGGGYLGGGWGRGGFGNGN